MEFTQIPTLIIRELKALDLQPKEVILLIYVLSFAFMLDDSSVVAVSLREMSRLTGLSSATIHSAKNGLVKKGFIAIVEVRNQERTATFDISPLEAKLSGFVKPSATTGQVQQKTDTADVQNNERIENHESDSGPTADQGQASE